MAPPEDAPKAALWRRALRALGEATRRYFVAGLLAFAPIGITFWISWSLVEAIDNWVTPMVPPRWNPETYLPFGVPGFGPNSGQSGRARRFFTAGSLGNRPCGSI